MASKKDILNNPREYTSDEIAAAIKSGVVTMYELSKSGNMTPLMRKRIEAKLNAKPEEAASEPSPVVQDAQGIAEPVDVPVIPEPSPEPAAAPASEPVITPAPSYAAPEPAAAPAPEPVITPAPSYAAPEPVIQEAPEAVIPEPVIPEPSVSDFAIPEPVIPETVVPDAVIPEPVIPEPVVSDAVIPEQNTGAVQYVQNSQSTEYQPRYQQIRISNKGMFRRPFSFNGRIRRTEYWLAYVIYMVWYFVMACIMFMAEATSDEAIGFAFVLFAITAIPMLWFIMAESCKRCHDRNNSGWFQLIPFYYFVLLFGNSAPGENQYGDNPKY